MKFSYLYILFCITLIFTLTYGDTATNITQTNVTESSNNTQATGFTSAGDNIQPSITAAMIAVIGCAIYLLQISMS